MNFKTCSGVTINDEDLVIHSITSQPQIDSSTPLQSSLIYKRPDCMVFMTNNENNVNCNKDFLKRFAKIERLKTNNINTPAKLNAPLSSRHPNNVKLALQQQRLKCIDLERQIEPK